MKGTLFLQLTGKTQGTFDGASNRVSKKHFDDFKPSPFTFPDIMKEKLVKDTKNEENESFRDVPVNEKETSTFRCPHGMFHCANSECVDRSARCNGHFDCTDQSDEHGCPIPKTQQKKSPKYKPSGAETKSDPKWEQERKKLPCGSGLWSCVDKSLCILPLQRCDGTNNCHDGSDEWECNGHREYAAYLHSPFTPKRPGHGTSEWRCSKGFYTCKNRQCILPKFRCDGKKHCNDGSDEWDCGQNTVEQLLTERDKRRSTHSGKEKEAFRKHKEFAEQMQKQRKKMEEEGFTVPTYTEEDKDEL